MKFLYKFFTNKIVSVLFVALFVIPQISNAQDELNAHPALWMIEKDNSKVYFLGSIHLLPKNVKWYESEERRIGKECTRVIDLSHAAAERIGLLSAGRAKVRLALLQN